MITINGSSDDNKKPCKSYSGDHGKSSSTSSDTTGKNFDREKIDKLPGPLKTNPGGSKNSKELKGIEKLRGSQKSNPGGSKNSQDRKGIEKLPGPLNTNPGGSKNSKGRKGIKQLRGPQKTNPDDSENSKDRKEIEKLRGSQKTNPDGSENSEDRKGIEKVPVSLKTDSVSMKPKTTRIQESQEAESKPLPGRKPSKPASKLAMLRGEKMKRKAESLEKINPSNERKKSRSETASGKSTSATSDSAEKCHDRRVGNDPLFSSETVPPKSKTDPFRNLKSIANSSKASKVLDKPQKSDRGHLIPKSSSLQLHKASEGVGDNLKTGPAILDPWLSFKRKIQANVHPVKEDIAQKEDRRHVEVEQVSKESTLENKGCNVDDLLKSDSDD